VAIVDDDFVDSTAAYALLVTGTEAEIVLIDQDRKLAEGQGYDLRDAEVSAVISLLVAPQM
jgi:malate/lactate dehydrogenase